MIVTHTITDTATGLTITGPAGATLSTGSALSDATITIDPAGRTVVGLGNTGLTYFSVNTSGDIPGVTDAFYVNSSNQCQIRGAGGQVELGNVGGLPGLRLLNNASLYTFIVSNDGSIASSGHVLASTYFSAPILKADTIVPQTTNGTVSLSTDGGLSLQDGNGSPVEGAKIRVLSAATTDGTATEMTVDGNSLTLADDTTHTYAVYISARSTSGSTNSSKSAFWKLEVAANATAGIAAIIGLELKTVVANEVLGTWDVATTFSGTDNLIKFTVTGGATDTITWTGWFTETSIVTA